MVKFPTENDNSTLPLDVKPSDTSDTVTNDAKNMENPFEKITEQQKRILRLGLERGESDFSDERENEEINDRAIEATVKELGKAIFSQVKISIQSASAAVIPNIPKVIEDLTEDVKKSSSENFGKMLQKLNKTVDDLGINLKDYNKELADFLQNREKNIMEKKQDQKFYSEQGIVTKIEEKTGELIILTEKEVEKKTFLLESLEKQINEREKIIRENAKIIQNQKDLSIKEIETRRAIIKENEKKIKEITPQSEELKNELQPVLNQKEQMGEKKGFASTISQGVSNFRQEFLPQPIDDVLTTFTSTLSAPLDIVRELGDTLLQFLKPFKLLLKPLSMLAKVFVPFFTLFKQKFALDKLSFGLQKLQVLTSAKALAAIALAGAGALAAYGLSKKGDQKQAGGFTKEDPSSEDLYSTDEGFLDDTQFQQMSYDENKTAIKKGKKQNIISPLEDVKNKNFFADMVNGNLKTPMMKPEDLIERKPTDQMATSNSVINAPKTTYYQNQHTLSGGLNLNNNDSWYNKSLMSS
jgi:hypothetical protein